MARREAGGEGEGGIRKAGNIKSLYWEINPKKKTFLLGITQIREATLYQ